MRNQEEILLMSKDKASDYKLESEEEKPTMDS
jgi:hypothetical protein